MNEFGGKRINQEILNKIIKEQKMKKEALINDDNEWISVKRDNNYRIVFNDKIIKIIKTRFLKELKKQKENKLNKFDEENVKLGKTDKNYFNKIMTKKEYNENIDKNRGYLIEYYDKKIKEIEKMGCESFILNFLSKEKKSTIKLLMSTNLSSNFSLNDLSTDISDKIDKTINNKDNKDDKDDEKEIDNKLNKITENLKISGIKRYIEDKIEVNNFFPYEQKNLRRGIGEEKDNKDIYNILKKLTDLNEKLKCYQKENDEKETKININQDDNEDIEN